VDHLVSRTALAGAAAAAAHVLIAPWWRSVEASVVAAGLRTWDVEVVRADAQLLVAPGNGVPFVLDIVAWCSSAWMVAIAAVLVAVPHGVPPRRRIDAFALVSCGLVIVNLIRLLGVVAVGAMTSPAAMDRVHDSVGVGLSLAALGAGSWVIRRRCAPQAEMADRPADASPWARFRRRSTNAASNAAPSVMTSITVASALSAGVEPARAPE
jgi:exosortase/archaeosortase family protein